MELVVSIVVLGILSLVGYGIIVLNARTFNSIKDNTVSHWDIRRAMQILRQDIQEIRPDNIIPPIKGQLSASELQFKALDGKVIYWRLNSSDILQRKVDTQPWMTFLEKVQTAPFSYLDIKGRVTNNKSKVVFIKVDLNTLNANKNVTLSDKFYVRN